MQRADATGGLESWQSALRLWQDEQPELLAIGIGNSHVDIRRCWIERRWTVSTKLSPDIKPVGAGDNQHRAIYCRAKSVSNHHLNGSQSQTAVLRTHLQHKFQSALKNTVINPEQLLQQQQEQWCGRRRNGSQLRPFVVIHQKRQKAVIAAVRSDGLLKTVSRLRSWLRINSAIKLCNWPLEYAKSSIVTLMRCIQTHKRRGRRRQKSRVGNQKPVPN